MKTLNFLSKSSSRSCSHRSVTLASTVGSQEEFYVSGGNSRGAFTPADVCQTSSVRLNRFTAHRRWSMVTHLTFMLLFLFGSLNAWGAPAVVSYNGTTQDASTTISATNQSTGSAGKVSWSATNGTWNSNKSRWEWASGSSITFTVQSGFVITEIETNTNSTKGTFSVSPTATITGNGTETCTISGLSANSVTITTSGNHYIKVGYVHVTYEAVASCTDPTTLLSISSTNTATVGTNKTLTTNGGNNGTVTWTVANGTGSATVSGNTLTPTGVGTVTVTATQEDNGGKCGKVVNQTITISKATANITLYDANGSSTPSGTFYGGDLYTPPTTAANCSGKVLVGWSTVEILEEGAKPSSNYADKGTAFTLSAGSNAFYAVYATQGGSAPSASSLEFTYASHSGWTIGGTYEDKSTYYLLKAASGSKGYIESPTISDLSTITSIVVHAGFFGGADYGTFKVYGGSTQYGDEKSPSSKNDNEFTLNPSPNPLSGSGKIKIINAGSTSSDNGTRLFSATINYSTGGYTYSKYSTSCCTPLVSINGSISWTNVSPTSVTVGVPSDYSDKDNANLEGYIFKRYAASTGGDALETIETDAANKTTATFNTGLVANTTYYYTIIAKHSSSSCNSAETSPRKSHKIDSYVVSYAAGGGSGDNPGAHDPVLSGTTVELKSNTFTAPVGKDFLNWNDGNDGYDEGEEISVTGNVTMTAQWECLEPGFTKNLSTSQVDYIQGVPASKLSVTAIANGATLSYAWEKSNNGTSGWTSVGTNSNEYTPSTTDAGDLYYHCIVTNGADGCGQTSTSAVAHIHVDVPEACLQPSISVASGTYYEDKSVTLSCNTDGATIYYTTDGNTPNSGSTPYTGAITVDQSMTIQAIAIKAGLDNSTVASATYTIKCVSPTIDLTAGNYTGAQTATITKGYGTKIYYTTDGSTPTNSNGTEYTAPITISTSQTLTAIVWKSGCTDSEPVSAAYTIKCAAPTITPGTDTYNANQSVTLASTHGTVYYTTDGTDPATYGVEYSSAISVEESQTIRAIAKMDGCNNSDENSATYTLQCETPTFNNGTGTYTDAQSITLSCATTGADIYYTLNGSTPSKENGTKYTNAITVGSNQTIKAIAIKEGWSDSDIDYATYTIQYNVYWWVNGVAWTGKGGSTLVTYGQTATAPTTAPTKANGCGDKFMGWTTIPDYEDDDTAPTGMFTETSTAITGETNFYAVFADYGEEE